MKYINYILFFSLLSQSCNNIQNEATQKENEYALQLIMKRIEKDKKIKEGEINIFDEKEKQAFEKLKYFKPNTEFIVQGQIEKSALQESITVQTSDGDKRTYLKFGYVTFEIKAKEHSLLLLKDPLDRSNKLFLTFTDGTSGEETYGAGRYLDVIPSGNSVLLDFNQLYNPYCAYNDSFSCPFPPKGNNISSKILAGEKTYKEL